MLNGVIEGTEPSTNEVRAYSWSLAVRVEASLDGVEESVGVSFSGKRPWIPGTQDLLSCLGVGVSSVFGL